MAVAAPTATDFSFSGTSQSVARTIDVTSNFLLVFVGTKFTPGTVSVTYGGNALSDLSGVQNVGSTIYGDILYLANPPTGSNTMAINITTARIGIVSYYGLSGVDTAGPFRTQTGGAQFLRFGANPATNPTFTLTGSAGDLALDQCVIEAATDTTLTATGANTEAMAQIRDFTGTVDYIRAGSSTATGGASVTMAWTLAASRIVQQLGVMIAAASGGGGGGGAPPRALLGVGC